MKKLQILIITLLITLSICALASSQVQAQSEPVVSLSPASWTMNLGQTETFTASASSGSGGYSYQWYVNSMLQSNNVASSFIFTPVALGSYSIYVIARDEIGTVSSPSNDVIVTVHSALVAPTISASVGTVNQGQTSNLTSTIPATGTSPYTYQWLQKAPGGSYVAVGTSSTSFSFVTSISTAVGIWSFELQVTDATSANVTSNPASVTVNAAPLDHFLFNSVGTQTAGIFFNITVTAKNVFNNTVTDYTGTPSLTYSAGSISPTTMNAFVSGVGSTSVNLTATGSGVSITATDGNHTGTSNSFVVAQGSLTHFVVSGFPNPTVAGVAHSVTVIAKDTYNNTVTGYAGTVKITSSDGKAVLPSNAGLPNGVGSFSVTLETAGSQSITATDTVSSSITGSQSGIQVNAGALASVSVSGPSSVTAGGTATFAATGSDAEGNSLGVQTASWSISSGASGSWSGNVYTSHTAGSWTVTVTVSGVHGTASLIVNPDVATHLVVSTGTSHVAGTAFSVTVTAKDANDNTATGYTDTVHFSSSDSGSGVSLPSDYTFLSGDLGTHTFISGVTLVTTGSQSITATDTRTSSIYGSQTGITVAVSSLTHFVVSGFPNPTVAGVAHSVTVIAKDTYNNTVTGYAGTVKITSSDGKAVLPSNAGLPNGVGSFSVTLETAGSQSITATDTVSSSITGSQSGITVNVASGVYFVVSGFPGSTVPGVAHSVTVTAYDTYGNVATGYSGTVAIASSDSAAVLPANSGLTGGVGSFSVTLKTAGSQSITATDTVTSSITGLQNGITVSTAPLDHFVFNTIGSQTVNSAFNITITAEDAANNTVAGYTGTPSLTYSVGSISPTTMNAFDSGIGTTSVTLSDAGSGVTITATDGAQTGTSNLFIVTLTPTPTPAVTPTPAPTSSSSPTSAPTHGTTPTPKPSATPIPSATVSATTSSGTKVDLAIRGNITNSQISNATITSNTSTKTVTVSFTITGAEGTAGFCNMTIPKTAISDGTSPIVYVDGQQAPNQGYMQDANNFYVWYTMHFSTHKVTIQFVASSVSQLTFEPLLAVGIAIPEIILIYTVIAIKRLKRKPDAA